MKALGWGVETLGRESLSNYTNQSSEQDMSDIIPACRKRINFI